MTRVLVVDDEPQILRGMRTNLRARGYEVETAATGEAALTQAAVRLPEAVILDLVLPGKSGVEVCSELRRWTDVPVLVLSAVGEAREKVAALDILSNGRVEFGSGESSSEAELGGFQIDPLLKQAQDVDAQDDAALGSRRGDELPAELRRREDLLATIEAAMKRLEAEAKAAAASLPASVGRVEPWVRTFASVQATLD